MIVAILSDDRRLRSDVLGIVRRAGYAAEAYGHDLRDLPARSAQVYVVDVTTSRHVETIRVLRARSPEIRVIAMAGDPGAVLATQVRRAGAHEFLRKPFGIDAIECALTTVTSPAPGPSAHEFLTDDDDMRRILDEIDRAAATDATIRIDGESGTGKNLLSRRIHERSPRRTGSRVVVGCAGLAGHMAESELFGHRPGMFGDASEGRVGHLVAASGGTLVLDEVAEIGLDLQSKLLWALQHQEVQPIGADAPEPVDLRLVSTNRKDLAEEVELGRFREDLLLRLDVLKFRIPPLRERPADIPLLARSLLARFADQ